MSRPITNRAARDIQDTDRMVITAKRSGSETVQEFLYEMDDIAGYILKAISASEDFTSKTSVTVTHNRGYRPIVWIEDGNNEMIDFECDHTSTLAFTITFAVGQSGSIHYI